MPQGGERNVAGGERNVSGGHRNADRYEPLPGFTRLPAWTWARMSHRARIGAGLAVLAAIAVGIALAPGIESGKKERAHAEEQATARQRAALLRRQKAEVRPVPGRLPGAPAASVAGRRSMLAALGDAVLRDARHRVATGALRKPVKSSECEPFPRSVSGRGTETRLGTPRGRYSCLAVTSTLVTTAHNRAGVIGYPYRAPLDFGSGRYAICKISGHPARAAST
jgi:hypothetical protein